MSTIPLHGNEPPSGWVQRWSHLVPPGGTVLDVACGAGRHLRWFHALGHPVTDDNEADALAILDWALAGDASCLR